MITELDKELQILDEDLILGILNTVKGIGRMHLLKMGEEANELSRSIHKLFYAMEHKHEYDLPIELWENVEKEMCDTLITIVISAYSMAWTPSIKEKIHEEIKRWS